MNEKQIERSDQSLTRGIMPWHVSLIALGGIIGSCYFLGLGLTFNEMGAGAIMITYAVAGITIYGVMQSFGELLVGVPRRGSFVSYTREFMGDTAAAGIGWAFWANWVCYIPSEALAVAIYINALIKEISGYECNNLLTFLWGVLALALLTFINVYHVKWFGHVESIMAIIKIFAIILFVIFGVIIWLGFANNTGGYTGETGFIGLTAAITEGRGSVAQQLFPSGGFIMITMMIWTLVNFQGSEIVGLSAAETQNPEVNVPLACKRVAYRIILIYLVPIFILSLIMPSYVATLDNSVFAQALLVYGFNWGASLFTVVTLIAAFSCANSGFYGTVRSVFGLSSEGLAPKFLSRLNRFHTPQNATLFTLAGIWIVFLLSFGVERLGLLGGEDNILYVALIGIAGFTGTLCWVGILGCQIIFRKKLIRRGYDPNEVLGMKGKWYPWLTWVAIIVQVAAMVLLIFERGDGIPIFVLSMDIIIIPVSIYSIQKYRGKVRNVVILGADEIMFDDKFPDKDNKDTKAETELKIGGGGGGLAILLALTTIVSVVLSIVTMAYYPADLAEEASIFTEPSMVKDWMFMIGLFATYVIFYYCVRALETRRAA